MCVCMRVRRSESSIVMKFIAGLLVIFYLYCSVDGVTQKGRFRVLIELSNYRNFYDKGSNGNRCESFSRHWAFSNCDPFFAVHMHNGHTHTTSHWKNKKYIHGSFMKKTFNFEERVSPQVDARGVTVDIYDHDTRVNDHIATIHATYHLRKNSNTRYEQKRHKYATVTITIKVSCFYGYDGDYCNYTKEAFAHLRASIHAVNATGAMNSTLPPANFSDVIDVVTEPSSAHHRIPEELNTTEVPTTSTLSLGSNHSTTLQAALALQILQNEASHSKVLLPVLLAGVLFLLVLSAALFIARRRRLPKKMPAVGYAPAHSNHIYNTDDVILAEASCVMDPSSEACTNHVYLLDNPQSDSVYEFA